MLCIDTLCIDTTFSNSSLLLGHLNLVLGDICSLHVDELKPLYNRHVVPLFHECPQE